MGRYNGVVIHRQVRDGRSIEVVEGRGLRSLHFDGDAIQSRMSLRDPDRLVLAYTRAMMGSLLFRPEATSAAIIGLGGGSLARFLLRHLPGCRVDGVEPDADVLDIAQRFFALPEDPRLTLHTCGGGEYVAALTQSVDLLLVDAFDAGGPIPLLNDPGFHDDMRRVLAPDGMLALNLWREKDGAHREVLDAVAARFATVFAVAPPQDPDNLVLLATPASPAPRKSQLRRQAAALGETTGMGFREVLKGLRTP